LQSNISKQVSGEVVTPNSFVVLALQSEQKTSKRSKKRTKKQYKYNILLEAI